MTTNPKPAPFCKEPPPRPKNHRARGGVGGGGGGASADMNHMTIAIWAMKPRDTTELHFIKNHRITLHTQTPFRK